MSLPDPKVILIQILGFLVVLIVFKMFLFKPILALLDSRRKDIEDDYHKAESTREAAQVQKAEYDRRLTEVEEEIRQLKSEEVKDAQRMKDEIIADARVQSDKILAKADAELTRAREQAVVEMRSTLADLVVKAAGKVIDAELDADKHSVLIDEFIEELDEVVK